MALRLRRGTDAERQSITPLEGELIYAIDTKQLYVGDGSTQGGKLVSAVLNDDTNPQLGGDLDLNGNNIVGTGNINIDGTITATGNINLGDGAEDNVIVGGQIGSSLIPGTTDTYNLGDSLARWNSVSAIRVNAESVTVDGELSAGSIVTDGNIIKSDSTVIYDAVTGSLSVGSITSAGSGNFNGIVNAAGFVGSVFADDSSTLVDAVNQTVLADVDSNRVNTSTYTGSTMVLEGTSIDAIQAGIRINTDGDRTDPYDLFHINAAKESSAAPILAFGKSRGTLDAQTSVQAGDELVNMLWSAHDSDDSPVPVASFGGVVSGTPSSGYVPGTLAMQVWNNLGIPVTAFAVNHDAEITVADNTLVAGVASGEVDNSAVASYLKITVGATAYALPLYAINP